MIVVDNRGPDRRCRSLSRRPSNTPVDDRHHAAGRRRRRRHSSSSPAATRCVAAPPTIVDATPGVAARQLRRRTTDFAGPATFSYIVDDQHGPHGRRGGDRHRATPRQHDRRRRASSPSTPKPAWRHRSPSTPLVIDPDVTSGDVSSYACSAGGAPVTLDRIDARGVAADRRHGQTDTIDYTVTDAHGRGGVGDRSRSRSPNRSDRRPPRCRTRRARRRASRCP